VIGYTTATENLNLEIAPSLCFCEHVADMLFAHRINMYGESGSPCHSPFVGLKGTEGMPCRLECPPHC